MVGSISSQTLDREKMIKQTKSWEIQLMQSFTQEIYRQYHFEYRTFGYLYQFIL